MNKTRNEKVTSDSGYTSILLRIPKSLKTRLFKYKRRLSDQLDRDVSASEILREALEKTLKNF